ncbi:hypothetical protein [Actinobacillus lignieresii]|uniref:Phage lysis regulatory protein, LysB family n=1 Tax=Actinobacillus lignieresii TaxID=720 RepID=A0A380TSY4_ACTLI|nr:hypothetical protein [Actinobacillus lignieresii]SUT91563.1 Uncharacterised protein [Actinobacillus lignieresii]
MFTKLIASLLLASIAGNLYTLYSKQSLEADLQAQSLKLAEAIEDRAKFAYQLKKEQVAFEVYKQQTEALNERITTQMQQAEERNNELLSELEKAKKWSATNVPEPISKLLNRRSTPSKAGSITLSTQK